jgi:hypothetical protein
MIFNNRIHADITIFLQLPTSIFIFIYLYYIFPENILIYIFILYISGEHSKRQR